MNRGAWLGLVVLALAAWAGGVHAAGEANAGVAAGAPAEKLGPVAAAIAAAAKDGNAEAVALQNGVAWDRGRVRVEVYFAAAAGAPAWPEGAQVLEEDGNAGWAMAWVPAEALEALAGEDTVAQVTASLAAPGGVPLEGLLPPLGARLDFVLWQLQAAARQGESVQKAAEALGLEARGDRVHVLVFLEEGAGAPGVEGLETEGEEREGPQGARVVAAWAPVEALEALAGAEGVAWVAPYAPLPPSPEALFREKASAALQALWDAFLQGEKVRDAAEARGLAMVGDKVRVKVRVAEGVDLVRALPGFERERDKETGDGAVVGNVAVEKLAELAAVPGVEALDAVEAEKPLPPSPVKAVEEGGGRGQPAPVLAAALFLAGLGLLVYALWRKKSAP